MRLVICILAIFNFVPMCGQSDWIWTELPSMPIHVSNNAVVGATVNGVDYVYSFGGIDSTKTGDGILSTSLRYDTQSMVWETLPDLPDTLGKIASAASLVDGIIYIIGGYHVFDGPPFELSSDRVHRFDPISNTFLGDGAPIPVAIDDQVQVVWRDSLILSITGWNDTQNVPDVQIYDPSNDVWTAGTSLPSSSIYTAFGASGSIVGDTIYYYGGASGGSFGATRRLRKGVVNEMDPTQISWSFVENSPFDPSYRSASVSIENKIFWIGGSAVSYNFDGIAYNGSGGVPPLSRVLEYDASDLSWEEGLGQEFGIMDLRGVARLNDSTYITAGGMEEGQQVTNRVFMLKYAPQPNSIVEDDLIESIIGSTVIDQGELLTLNLIRFKEDVHCALFDLSGRQVQESFLAPGYHSLPKTAPNENGAGIYLLRLSSLGFERSIPLLIK